MIRTVEIICRPCMKCQGLEVQIKNIIKSIEMTNKIKIPYTFEQKTDLNELSKFSLNPSQTPAILINGQVEMTGQPNFLQFKKRLEAIHKMG